ncbi:MAG: hypothetical protein RJA36_1022 [Pseudomonadota bacterium]|jgi:hypothetical protein
MLLRQSSLLNGFRHEFVDDSGQAMGDFEHPWYAQARNARLRVYDEENAARGDIRMRLCGRDWRLRHLFLRRGWNNDIRYTLEDEDGAVHAEADALVIDTGRLLPRIVLQRPVQAEVAGAQGWLRRRHVLRENGSGRELGCISEPAAITLRRELRLDLPGLAPPVAAFLGIVVLIVRY